MLLIYLPPPDCRQDFLIWTDVYEKLVGYELKTLKMVGDLWFGQSLSNQYICLKFDKCIISIGMGDTEKLAQDSLRPIGLLNTPSTSNISDFCYHVGWTVPKFYSLDVET